MLDAPDVKFEPLWWEDARPGPGTSDEPPAGTDVLVVGSGYAGLNCAIELARAGTDVTVVDAMAIGEGASSRAAGFTSGRTGVSKQINLTAMVGADRAGAILAEADEAYEALKDRISVEAIDCDFQQRGRYTGAFTARARDKLARKMAEYKADGYAHLKMVTPEEQGAYVKTDHYQGGMMMLDAGSIHPAKYHAGLVRLAEAAGVRTVAHCAVEGIVPEDGGFRVVTSKGDVKAGRVALGTNGYTGAATPWHQRRIIPISSSLIATEPLGEDVVSGLLPAGCPVIDTKRVAELARPSPDGTRLVFGGRASFLRISEEKRLSILQAKMAAMFPEVADARITHVWGGQMGFTFDFLPKTGQHDGVDYAIGCNGGCGIVMMSWLGRKMAGQILGSANRASAFRGLEFKTQPFYGGKPWFLPIVGNWYRLRDWWDLKRDRAGSQPSSASAGQS